MSLWTIHRSTTYFQKLWSERGNKRMNTTHKNLQYINTATITDKQNDVKKKICLIPWDTTVTKTYGKNLAKTFDCIEMIFLRFFQTVSYSVWGLVMKLITSHQLSCFSNVNNSVKKEKSWNCNFVSWGWLNDLFVPGPWADQNPPCYVLIFLPLTIRPWEACLVW